jgi:hypothetical protein
VIFFHVRNLVYLFRDTLKDSCYLNVVKCSLGPCGVDTSRSNTGSCCPDTSRCTSDPCGVDTSKCSKGFFCPDSKIFPTKLYRIPYGKMSRNTVKFHSQNVAEFREISRNCVYCIKNSVCRVLLQRDCYTTQIKGRGLNI